MATDLAKPSTPINPKLEPRVDPATNRMVVGRFSVAQTSLLTALLYGFKHHTNWREREYYFWRCADEMWNTRPELALPMFERNPWSEKTIRYAIRNKYLAVGGAANSAKSHTMAGYGIIKWLSDPANTLVLITSTTLIEARKRIWGSVIKLMSVIEDIAPCKIRDSIGSIAYVNAKGRLFDTAGISLIAAEKAQTREATGKFIGIKAGTVLVIADELSELSPAIIEACMTNLSKNPKLEVKAMSNPSSRFDAFGDWATPKGGWDKVNVMADEEWETSRGGTFIRLDGEKSPNILAGRTIYPYLPTQEQLDEDRAVIGVDSRGYMRMVRAIFFDSDDEEVIYTEGDIAKNRGTSAANWMTRPTLVAGLDPGFTNGGDRCVLHVGHIGYETDGRLTFEFGKHHLLFDDASDKATPRTYQIVTQLKELCTRLGIPPENLAIDATGAGAPFCDVVAGEWSPKFTRVSFGGAPTDMRVSDVHARTADELYANMVSELWYVGKELLRTQQIRGIRPELANEITKRSFSLVKSGSLRIQIESKKAFKLRIGRSPDIADAGFLALHVARVRFGLSSIALPELTADGQLRRIPKPRRSIGDLREALHNDDAYLPDN
jgi:hypothetical protein